MMTIGKGRNADRLREMILFVIARMEPPPGKTKLAKVLWEADVLSMRLRGRSLSGREAYVRLPHGPVPDGLEDCLEDLVREGMVHRHRRRVLDHEEIVHLPAEDMTAPLNDFTPEEVDILHRAIAAIAPLTAREASARTHDALWEETPMGASISIAAAAIRPAPVTEKVLAWAREELAALAAESPERM